MYFTLQLFFLSFNDLLQCAHPLSAAWFLCEHTSCWLSVEEGAQCGNRIPRLCVTRARTHIYAYTYLTDNQVEPAVRWLGKLYLNCVFLRNLHVFPLFCASLSTVFIGPLAPVTVGIIHKFGPGGRAFLFRIYRKICTQYTGKKCFLFSLGLSRIIIESFRTKYIGNIVIINARNY